MYFCIWVLKLENIIVSYFLIPLIFCLFKYLEFKISPNKKLYTVRYYKNIILYFIKSSIYIILDFGLFLPRKTFFPFHCPGFLSLVTTKKPRPEISKTKIPLYLDKHGESIKENSNSIHNGFEINEVQLKKAKKIFYNNDFIFD